MNLAGRLFLAQRSVAFRFRAVEHEKEWLIFFGACTGRRFKHRVRQLTRRCVPLKTKDLIEQLNPLLRGWSIHSTGGKTDRIDSAWLAELLQHGLLKSSFVPPRPIRELRDLTRYGGNLAQHCNPDSEGAGGRQSQACCGGHGRSRSLRPCDAEGHRRREQEVEKAGRDVARFAAPEDPSTSASFAGIRDAASSFPAERAGSPGIRRIQDDSAGTADRRATTPFEDTVCRLCTVPGIDRISAGGIISEIGLDMHQFADAKHLAGWAGLCPGNWESAGKRKSGRIRKGSAWLRRDLCQSVCGVSTKLL